MGFALSSRTVSSSLRGQQQGRGRENQIPQYNHSNTNELNHRDLVVNLDTDCYQFDVVFKKGAEVPNQNGMACMEEAIRTNTAALAKEYLVKKLKYPESVVWGVVEQVVQQDPEVQKAVKKIVKVKQEEEKLEQQYQEKKQELEEETLEIELKAQKSLEEQEERTEKDFKRVQEKLMHERTRKEERQKLEQELSRKTLEGKERIEKIINEKQKRLEELESDHKKQMERLDEKKAKVELEKQELLEELDIAKREAELKRQKELEKLEEERRSGGGLPEVTQKPKKLTRAQKKKLRRRRRRARWKARYRLKVSCTFCRPEDVEDAGRLLGSEESISLDNFETTTSFEEWMDKGMEKQLEKACAVAKKELDYVEFSYVDINEEHELYEDNVNN